MKTPFTDTHRVIADVIDEHNYIHEFRGQKIVYLLDLYTQLRYGERVTDCDFYPYMYGPFSPQIEDGFEDLKTEGWATQPDYLYGRVVSKYLSYDTTAERDISIEPSEYTDEIRTVTNATSDWTNKELQNWLKSSRVYQHAEYNRPIRFDRLEPMRDQLIENLTDAFPELVFP